MTFLSFVKYIYHYTECATDLEKQSEIIILEQICTTFAAIGIFWVNFTSILRAAFAHTDPKRAKGHWWLDCLFVLLVSSSVKAVHKHVGEIDPRAESKIGSSLKSNHGYKI